MRSPQINVLIVLVADVVMLLQIENIVIVLRFTLITIANVLIVTQKIGIEHENIRTADGNDQRRNST